MKTESAASSFNAEDNELVLFMYEKLMRENRIGFEHMDRGYNTPSEEHVVQPGDPLGRVLPPLRVSETASPFHYAGVGCGPRTRPPGRASVGAPSRQVGWPATMVAT